jgi:hypothetical protein
VGEWDGCPEGYSNVGLRVGSVDGWYVYDCVGVSDNNNDGTVDGEEVDATLGDAIGRND